MIELIHVRKSYDDRPVLKDVTLSVHRGETLVILGESGCGKTVLLRIIIGLIPADGGEVRINGFTVTGAERKDLFRMRRKMGLVFQGSALFDSMTVEKNIGLPLVENASLEPSEISVKVSELLKRVGLEGCEKKYPAELSGGMKKRVGLARALIVEPDILLYDEPTTGLDPIMSGSITALIRDMQQSRGITSIAVTHDMMCAFAIADRIALLHGGEIIFHGNPDEFRACRNGTVRRFKHTHVNTPS